MTDELNLFAEARARSLSPKDENVKQNIIDTLPEDFWFEKQIDLLKSYRERYKEDLPYFINTFTINNHVMIQHKLDDVFFYFNKNIILFTTFNSKTILQALPTELVDFLGVNYYRKTLIPVNNNQMILHSFTLNYSLKCMTSITSTMKYSSQDISCENRTAKWVLPENGGIILRLYVKKGVRGLLYNKLCEYDTDVILLEPNLHYSVTNFSCASFFQNGIKKEFVFIDACVEKIE